MATRQTGVPDPMAAAQAEAVRIQANRQAVLYSGLERTLLDAPRADRKALLAGLVAYHREARSRIPPHAKYPEAKPWVEYTLAFERELQRLAPLTEEELAIARSLPDYLSFRGFRQAGLHGVPAPQAEKCRVAFLLETDRGPLHVKNVDDPLGKWKPEPPPPARAPLRESWWGPHDWVGDGVGSGLHIDDEPKELFPLPALAMARQHAHDTPGVVQFLTRYSPFWGGGNLAIMDKQFRFMAVEKCSRNHIEVFPPSPEGWCHVSGMVCRDPGSPQGRYQKARRDEYRQLYEMPEDGPDAVFWAFCDEGERKLVTGLRRLGRRPKVEDVQRLFWTTWPEGLCKPGIKVHPQQAMAEYTLQMRMTVFAERRYFLWQRSEGGKVWPREPSECRYE